MRDENGKTPLHIAATHKNTSMVQLLLEKGADVNAKDNLKRTALHDASRNKRIRGIVLRYINFNAEDSHTTVQLLLNSGADVNVKDKDGETPLHYVVAIGDESRVHLLLEAGADPGITDNQGETAMDIAVQCGDKPAVQLLEAQAGTKTSSTPT